MDSALLRRPGPGRREMRSGLKRRTAGDTGSAGLVRGLGGAAKRIALTVVVALVIAVATAGPAAAQMALDGFTGSTVQDWYLVANQRKCVEGGGGPPPCLAHSFTYVTANDLGGSYFMGALLFYRYDHSYYDAHWDYNIARHCAPGYQYGNTCVDQDHTFNHAGAANGGPGGTTVRMRPWW